VCETGGREVEGRVCAGQVAVRRRRGTTASQGMPLPLSAATTDTTAKRAWPVVCWSMGEATLRQLTFSPDDKASRKGRAVHNRTYIIHKHFLLYRGLRF